MDTPAAAATTGAEPATADTSGQTDPITMLSDALQDAGMDPAQYPMSVWSETVYYPGGQFLQAGSYVNNCITVDLGEHGKHSFSSDLMARNPSVTVSEIKHILTLPV